MKHLELIVLRHGEAGNRVTTPTKDLERTLTASGKREVEQIAKSIKSMQLKITHIATSPLARSLETAKIVAKTLNKSKALQEWDELKPESDRSSFYMRLSEFKENSTVLIVGHEPFLSSLIGDLIAGKSTSHIVLKKAGLAKVAIDSLSPKASGRLRWLLTPRQLKNLS